MEIINFYKNSFKLFLLDETAYKEIKDNFDVKEAFYAFIILTAINAFISSLISYIGTSSVQPLYWIILKSVFGITIFSLIAVMISIGILHSAIKMFGAKEDYSSSLKFAISSYIAPTIIIAIASYIIQSVYRNTEFSQLTYGAKDLFFIITYVLIIIIFSVWNLVVIAKTYSKIHELPMSKIIYSFIIMMIIGLILLGIVIGILYLIVQSLIQ